MDLIPWMPSPTVAPSALSLLRRRFLTSFCSPRTLCVDIGDRDKCVSSSFDNIVPDQQVAVEVVHVVPVGDCVDQNCDVPGRGQCFGWRVAWLAEAEADAGVVGVLGI
eukprot:scaffold39150_cov35-Attheya_sp.AAC.1